MISADPTSPSTRGALGAQGVVNGAHGRASCCRSSRLVLEYPAQRERCCHTGGGMTWDRRRESLHHGRQQHRQRRDDRRAARARELGRSTRARRTRTTCAARSFASIRSLTAATRFRKATCFRRARRARGRRSTRWATATRGACRSTAGPATSIGARSGRRWASERAARAAYDELNQARGPGFFGWPYFVGDEQAVPVPRLRDRPAAAGQRSAEADQHVREQHGPP